MVLAVPDEPFCILDSTLHSPKAVHRLMLGPEVRFRMLTGVSETCCLLAAQGCGNVDIVCRLENLGLFTLLDFKVIKIEFLASRQPGVVGQQRRNPMVAVRIDGPMGCLLYTSRCV